MALRAVQRRSSVRLVSDLRTVVSPQKRDYYTALVDLVAPCTSASVFFNERHNTHNSWRAGFLAPLSVGAAAAALTCAQADDTRGARCDSAAAGPAEASTKSGQPAGNSALEQVRAEVKAMWKAVQAGVPLEGAAPPSLQQHGRRVSIRLSILQDADLARIVVEAMSRMGHLAGGTKQGVVKAPLHVHAWQSAVAHQISVTSTTPDAATEADDALTLQLFVPLIGATQAELIFSKEGPYSDDELAVVKAMMRLAYSPQPFNPRLASPPVPHWFEEFVQGSRGSEGGAGPGARGGAAQGSAASDPHEAALATLEGLGATVHLPAGSGEEGEGAVRERWEGLAGYAEQKRELEDTLLLSIQHPEVYREIVRRTRGTTPPGGSIHPRAVLLEGPPGNGKTTSARLLAAHAGVPMVYVPLEAVMSKYYGEAEKRLAEIFHACAAFDVVVLFLDEVDALATTRGAEMHEATRRVLSVLLRQLEGFVASSEQQTVVLAATNRKQDLDPALLSRFTTVIRFDPPDSACRVSILQRYARHLSPSEHAQLARATAGMSARDLRNICERTERAWASQLIREQIARKSPAASASHELPPVRNYLDSAQRLRASTSDVGAPN